MRHSIHILTAVSCALGAFSAQAATLCVDKVNPACFTGPTAIQDAVDAAFVGDIIKIGAGTFKEAVLVGTDGITLAGLGATKTIIDSNDVLATVGLDIAANNVTVSGLGVNNTNGATGIQVVGDGLKLLKSAVNNTTSGGGFPCLTVDGDNALVDGNRFSGCENLAVDLGVNAPNDNAVVKNNKILLVSGEGVFIDGDNAIFEKNSCEDTGGYCVDVVGDNAIIRSNRGTNMILGGLVFLDGANALVQSNTATGLFNIGAGAIDVVGDNPRVLTNRVAGASAIAGSGVDVVCTTSCAATQVVSNTVLNMTGFAFCYDVQQDVAGGIVKNNAGTSCALGGMSLEGAGGYTAEANRLSKGGITTFTGGHGIMVDGMGAKTLKSNSAKFFGGSGFAVFTGGHLLQKNTASGNNRKGFFLDNAAPGVTMLQNTATTNLQEGVENQGDSNNFIGNIVKTNRSGTDFCENGTTTVQTVAQLQSLNTIGSPVDNDGTCVN